MKAAHLTGNLGKDAVESVRVKPRHAPVDAMQSEPVPAQTEPLPLQTEPPPTITGEQLRKICPSLPSARADSLAAATRDAAPQYGINTPLRLSHFLAQVAHECNEFKAQRESMNYTVKGILDTFGRHRISEEDAKRLGRPTKSSPARPLALQQELANTVYGGAWGRENLGNTQSNDGWFMRGGGPLQTTGRYNWTEYAKHKGISVTDAVEWATTLDHWMIDCACYVFAVRLKLLDECDRDDVLAVSRGVNLGNPKSTGTPHGMPQRKAYLARAKAVLLS